MADTLAVQLEAPRPSYIVGVVLVLLAGACWSSMGVGIRLIEAANVWQILLYRSVALALFLFAIIAWRSGFRPLQRIRKAGLAGAIGGAGLVVAPLLAAFLGWVVLREAVRRATWIAMLVGLAGVAVMVANGVSAGRTVGNLSALLSASGFAVFTIALRWGKLEDMLPAVFLAGVFATLTAAIACAIGGHSYTIPAHDVAIALALGVFQIGVGLTIFTIGSKVVPAAELALLSMTEVLLAPLWVWLFLGETADPETLLGGAILLLAIAGNALSGLRRKPVPVL